MEFKGYTIEEIMDEVRFGLKLALEQKLVSKLDGLLNTEDAHVVDANTTIYYVKGLYNGVVAGQDLSAVEFVIVEGKTIGIYAY